MRRKNRPVGNIDTRSAELPLSIHSESAIYFIATEVQTKSWVSVILRKGYMPDFDTLPTPYAEQNHRSPCVHIDVVREKLAEWLQEGFVEQLSEPAHCCNLLVVAVK
jgi:hypothetical protein